MDSNGGEKSKRRIIEDDVVSPKKRRSDDNRSDNESDSTNRRTRRRRHDDRSRSRYDSEDERRRHYHRRRASPTPPDYEGGRRPWHWRSRHEGGGHSPAPGSQPLTEEERKRKELDDARRDDLTVLVANVSLKATEQDVADFFNQHAGKVRAVKIIKDPRSGKSKGIGYVEFEDAGSVLKSLNLTNQFILNQPIRVQASQAEKNRAARAAKQQQEQMAAQGPCKIYVGGLTDELSEVSRNELRQLFSPFGTIIQIDVPKDPYTQRNKGYAFVQYVEPSQARDAMLAMHGFQIGDKTIKVGFADTNNKTNGIPGGSGSLEDLDRIADDHDDRILKGGPAMRIALSQKLAQKVKDNSFASSLNPQPKHPATIDGMTEILTLKNMFTKQEVDQGGAFEVLDDIEDEVKNECLKFGLVTDVFIDHEKLDGCVHIRFSDVSESVAAYRALNGRFFGGQKVQVDFLDPVQFTAMKSSAAI